MARLEESMYALLTWCCKDVSAAVGQNPDELSEGASKEPQLTRVELYPYCLAAS